MLASRRDFLVGAASVAGATLVAAQARRSDAAAPLDPQSAPIVDTHQHLWDLEKFRLPWLAEAKELARSYVTKDYLAAIEGTHTVQAVYMEVDVEPSQQTEEAEHVLRLAQEPKKNITTAAVISGRPAAPEFKQYLAKFKDVAGIKGVRQVIHVPQTPRGFCLQDAFVAGVRLLGEWGKSFDVCMRPAELADAVKLAERCPDTRLILDHCGNADPKLFGKKGAAGDAKPDHDPDDWRRQIAALAKKPNVICKISGIIARVKKGAWSADDLAPVVNHCLDEFGPDRVVFGSDWPVCTLGASLKEWVVALRQIIASRPAADQRKLLAENARRLYRLDA